MTLVVLPSALTLKSLKVVPLMKFARILCEKVAVTLVCGATPVASVRSARFKQHAICMVCIGHLPVRHPVNEKNSHLADAHCPVAS
jgi:hypothetical protein